MSPTLVLAAAAGYFGLLLAIGWLTSRHADAQAYFLGNRRSRWWVVMVGFIGDSISGVTFISVPGAVAATQFSYLQIALGYVAGYLVISFVLLPVYYGGQHASIYRYLGLRFGLWTERTGASFFLVSRTLGAAARLYLAAGVLQAFVFDAWGVPFALTVALILALILAYTFRGGIRTLVWTDLFQSGCLLLGVGLSIAAIVRALGLDAAGLWAVVQDSPHSQVFFWNDWRGGRFFWKQFAGGALIAIAMTGLDQNMMQKTLSCRSLREAQKNVNWYALAAFVVNGMFLVLGALLYHYVEVNGVAAPARSDQLFPSVALGHLGPFAAAVFVIGLTAATFNSADSVLTTLTTSFYFDILGLGEREALDDEAGARARHAIHVAFAVVLLLTILLFQWASSGAVITLVLQMANYTYGPLLGLFAFGLFTRRRVRDAAVPAVCLGAPVVCWVLDANSVVWLDGYRFSNELLAVNGALTAVGLWATGMSRR